MAGITTVLARGSWHLLTQNRRRLRDVQRTVLSETAGRRVLEIGSGQRRGARAFQSAVDLAPHGAEFVMTDVDPGLGHRVLDIRRPDEELGRFDVVLCCNVLEHVTDLDLAVDGLAAMCADDGEVLVSTPFLYPYHDEPGDFWRPTSHGLEHLLRRRFTEVTVSWTGMRRLPFQMFVRARRPLR